MVSSSTDAEQHLPKLRRMAKANERTDSNSSEPRNAGPTDPAPARMVTKTNSPEVVQ